MITYQPGMYQVTCLDHGFELAKTGRPMIVFRVGVEARIENAVGPDGVVREQATPVMKRWERTIRVVVTEDNQESLDYALRKLRYAGFTGSRFEELDLIGLQFRAECTKDSYQGKEVERWDLPLPPTSGREIKSDPNLAKKMNALFGKRLAETGVPPAPKPEPVGGGVPAADDDLPFSWALVALPLASILGGMVL